MVAIDLSLDEMPPLLQAYLYISATSDEFQEEIVATVANEKAREKR